MSVVKFDKYVILILDNNISVKSEIFAWQVAKATVIIKLVDRGPCSN